MLGLSTYLDTQKGNYFQRHWNGHDKWKDANSHCHTFMIRIDHLMIRIDHLIYNDYVCNPLLNDLVIDFDTELDILTARLEIQTNRISPIVSHMRWSMFAVVRFRGMCFRPIQLS